MITFSIITVTHNRASSGYLEKCIESIQNQKNIDFSYEHIIIDDGSTDNTKNLVKKLQSQDKRIKYYHKKNEGLAKGLKTGIEKAQGQYLFKIDDDDMLSEYSLKFRYDFIEKNPGIDWFYGLAQWIDEFGLPTKQLYQSKYYDDFAYERMLVSNYIHGGTETIKTEILKEIEWPDWLKWSQDYFLWLELLRPEKNFKLGFLNKTLLLYRYHNQSYTARIDTKQKKEQKKELNTRIKSLHNQSLAFLADQAFWWSENSKEVEEAWNKRLQYTVRNNEKHTRYLKNRLNSYEKSRFIKPVIKARNVKRAQSIRIKEKLASVKREILVSNKKPNYLTIDQELWPAGMPLISVVTPFFNRDDTMPETVRSVLNQSYQNFEYIIVNDGSTEEESINYISNLKHPKIQLINKKNEGVAKARNAGIKAARGKYILCLDSDDLIEKTYIEKAILVMETDPNVSLVTYDMQMFGEKEDIFRYKNYNPYQLLNDNFIVTAAVFKKEAWLATEGYKNDIGYEDWEFWVDITEKGYIGKHLPELLFRYRTAETSRYTEDLRNHYANAKFIKRTHPNYKKHVKKHVKKLSDTKIIVNKETLFTNLQNKNNYLLPKNGLKNVLIAVPWMTFGGAETLIYNFCTEIKDSFNISFITGLKSDNEWEYKFKEITEDIYHLANMFNEEKHVYLEFIINYIKTRDIEVLHIIHCGYLFDLLPEIKERLPELKIITTLFNDRVEYFEQSIKKQKYIDMYSTDNAKVAKHYKNRIDDEGKVVIIPNGIDSSDKYNPNLFNRDKERSSLGIKTDDIAVFFIGRLSEEKNPDVFLEVANDILKANNKRIKFFIIGDGPMNKTIKTIIKEINNSNIEYIGYKSEVAHYLSAADIFILPSSIEGFPLSLLEAMAMEVVPIASDVGAVSEVMENGSEGFVVNPAGSSEKIKNVLQKLIADQKLIRKIGISARSKVENKYSSTKLGENYKELYRKIL